MIDTKAFDIKYLEHMMEYLDVLIENQDNKEEIQKLTISEFNELIQKKIDEYYGE